MLFQFSPALLQCCLGPQHLDRQVNLQHTTSSEGVQQNAWTAPPMLAGAICRTNIHGLPCAWLIKLCSYATQRWRANNQPVDNACVFTWCAHILCVFVTHVPPVEGV